MYVFITCCDFSLPLTVTRPWSHWVEEFLRVWHFMGQGGPHGYVKSAVWHSLRHPLWHGFTSHSPLCIGFFLSSSEFAHVEITSYLLNVSFKPVCSCPSGILHGRPCLLIKPLFPLAYFNQTILTFLLPTWMFFPTSYSFMGSHIFFLFSCHSLYFDFLTHTVFTGSAIH